MRSKSWVPMYYIEDAEWDDASETRWSLDADGCLRGDCGLPYVPEGRAPRESRKWKADLLPSAELRQMTARIVHEAQQRNRTTWTPIFS